jgi:hypothetical protein
MSNQNEQTNRPVGPDRIVPPDAVNSDGKPDGNSNFTFKSIILII